MDDLVSLGLVLAATLAVAAAGGLATAGSVRTWYPTLAKPRWTPPNAVFGPAWSILYVLMAAAAWIAVRSGTDVTRSLAWYGAQLGLNLLWSLVFFGLRSPAAGLAVIGLLWCAIAGTIVAFADASVVAAALLVPYLAWVTFASALNAAVVRLTGRRSVA